MDLAGRCTQRRVPVTGIARTVLDIAGVSGRAELDALVDAVLRQRLLRWPDLLGVLVRHSRRGRDGCGRLRALLDERYGETRPPDSKFNRLVGDLLRDAGIGQANFEYELLRGERFVARVDLAFPASKLAIELDSRRYHDNELSFVSDRRRANQIVNLGWTLLSFTWDDYRDTPHVLVQHVRDALSRRSVDI
jgi:very-short-patch-repair endonuclease